jgi:hypothetical protein
VEVGYQGYCDGLKRRENKPEPSRAHFLRHEYCSIKVSGDDDKGKGKLKKQGTSGTRAKDWVQTA